MSTVTKPGLQVRTAQRRNGASASAAAPMPVAVAPRTVVLAGALGAAGANALLGAVSGAGAAIPLRFATGFFLAGDWIDTGLPATIESAVVSGHRAAEAVLRFM